MGGYDCNAVQGDSNAIGLAFDVAAQFSLVWGRAYFDQVLQNGGPNPSASARATLDSFQAVLASAVFFNSRANSSAGTGLLK